MWLLNDLRVVNSYVTYFFCYFTKVKVLIGLIRIFSFQKYNVDWAHRQLLISKLVRVQPEYLQLILIFSDESALEE